MKNCVIYILTAVVSLEVLAACQPADVLGPRGSKDAPAKVKIQEISNLPGKSIIYYDLPNDDNLKYIKAVFTPRSGVTSEVNASFFTDSLVVEGFCDEGDHQVQLYSVSTGGVLSDPVTCTVSPTKPSYKLVSESAVAAPIFGGFKFEAVNTEAENVFISIEQQNDSGEWEILGQYPTESKEISIKKRGLDAKESHFRYTVEDYWGNATDPVEFTLTPFFEEKCSKRLWKYVLTPDEPAWGTYSVSSQTGGVTNIWDEQSGPGEAKCWQTANGGTYPVNLKNGPIAITIDLGASYTLSRMEMLPMYRTGTAYSTLYEKYFSGGDIKDFEIYIAETLDTENPLFDSEGNLNPNWTLLYKGAVTRPSGKTGTSVMETLTDEEVYNYAHRIPRDFEFDIVPTPARFFKIRFLSNWGGSSYVIVGEITLFGECKQ